MRRNDVLTKGPLLNQEGNLEQAGYAKSLVKNYDRNSVKGSKLRIKEWDYYLITNDEFGIALTVADNSYMGLIGASFLDFKNKREHTTNIMTVLPRGKYCLPPTSEKGNTIFRNKRVDAVFLNNRTHRKLHMYMKNFEGGRDFKADIVLTEMPQHDSIVIATPFEKQGHFYYNQKIVGMAAKGRVEYNGRIYVVDSKDSYGMFDWGRGVWTYSNTWYWSAAQGKINGVNFGFNLGYGFGDTSAASENMIFYNGVGHKLEDITMHIPMDSKGNESYLEPWRFTSSDGRFEMNFVPIIDRASCTNALVILSDQHQVFGKFTGKAVLDDGTVIEVKDFLGMAEKVRNKW